MAHFLHGWGAELTADDYTKATAAISVMEAFGISVAGGSFTHKLNIWRRWAHVSRRGSNLRWIVDQLPEAPRLSGAPNALVALPRLRLVVLALVQGSRARACCTEACPLTWRQQRTLIDLDLQEVDVDVRQLIRSAGPGSSTCRNTHPTSTPSSRSSPSSTVEAVCLAIGNKMDPHSGTA